MWLRALAICAALSACSTAPQPPVTPDVELPVMRRFSGVPTPVSPRSNAEIAEDFLDLAFRLETGQELPILTRFEEPISIRVLGPASPAMTADLDALLARIRREARIDIRMVSADQPANLTVELVSRRDIRRVIPGAACFVMPNVSDYEELLSTRHRARGVWTGLQQRQKMAIFLPLDEGPQETRDCLHEEIAQALGPVNDLYRLQDSVFNDDNMHTVLTSFDMLILRAYYSDTLWNGMSRAEAAKRIPRVLSQMNPAGRGYSGAPLTDSPSSWLRSVETALRSPAGSARQVREAEKARKIAVEQNWNDGRLGFSLFLEGRALIGRDNDAAAKRLLEAEKVYHHLGRADLQAAHVSLHLAAFALSAGQNDVVIDRVDHYSPVVRGGQNAALYAKMLMLKAEALDRLDRPKDAAAVRLDSLGWARYGFASERVIRDELRNIAAIGKRGQT